MPANNLFSFHHVGVAVANLAEAVELYSQAFGYVVLSGPFEDPIQKVSACFMGDAAHGSAPIELICPQAAESPVNGYLSKGVGAYHICYEVGEIEVALAHLKSTGCLVLGDPVSAVAFSGRKIAWCFTPTRQLVELVERA